MFLEGRFRGINELETVPQVYKNLQNVNKIEVKVKEDLKNQEQQKKVLEI